MSTARSLAAAIGAAALALAACGPTAPSRQRMEGSSVDQAREFPAFTGYVVDAADVLPSGTGRRLEDRLRRFEQRTGHQLAIVTVPTLRGESIDRYSLRLFNAWGIGMKGANDGIAILVAPTERKVRIEVGTGLETRLTNAECSGIIEREILPAFKRGDLPGGVEEGANAIIAILQ